MELNDLMIAELISREFRYLPFLFDLEVAVRDQPDKHVCITATGFTGNTVLVTIPFAIRSSQHFTAPDVTTYLHDVSEQLTRDFERAYLARQCSQYDRTKPQNGKWKLFLFWDGFEKIVTEDIQKYDEIPKHLALRVMHGQKTRVIALKNDRDLQDALATDIILTLEKHSFVTKSAIYRG